MPVAAFLPDFARSAHGNLAKQNQPVSAQRGADMTRPEVKTPVSGDAAEGSVMVAQAPAWHKTDYLTGRIKSGGSGV